MVPPPIARGRTIARRERRGSLTRSAGGARQEGWLRDAATGDRTPQGAGAGRQADLGQFGRGLDGGAEDVRDRSAGSAGAARWGRSGRRRVGRAGAAAAWAPGGWPAARVAGWPARALALAARPGAVAGSLRVVRAGGVSVVLPALRQAGRRRGRAWRCGGGAGAAAGRRARPEGRCSLIVGHHGVLQRWPSHTSTTRARKIRATLKPPLPVRRIDSTSRACDATKGVRSAATGLNAGAGYANCTQPARPAGPER